jgi:TonB family protein
MIQLRTAVREGKEWRYSLVVSIALHALLLLLFAAIRIRLEFPVPRFVEMTFVSGSLEPSGGAALTAASASARPEPQPVASAVDLSGPGNQPVSLPRRRMVEEEQPILRASDEGKLAPTEAVRPAVPEPRAEGMSRGLSEDRLRSERGEKVGPIPGEGSLEGKPSGQLPGSEQAEGEGGFTIQGEAAQRTILYKVIPEYPEGVNKDAVVRIRFTVLPSGIVGSAVLLTKGGEATLERLTLEAFRQWRFSPLPPDVPQVDQEGVITFRWVLR